ncbi:MAG: single-stranded DNA-binding protein [Bacteroidales bacterium]|nr:single-stranded DNA-binding protein [Bacteroidales bacterium]
MSDFKNRVQLVGNLGMDPEVINFDSGNKLAKFSLATNRSYKNKQGEYEKETQWHNIVVWGNQVELAQKLKKGNYIAIEGRLEYRTYDDKQGNKKYITEIKLRNFILMNSPSTETTTTYEPIEQTSDLPF